MHYKPMKQIFQGVTRILIIYLPRIASRNILIKYTNSLSTHFLLFFEVTRLSQMENPDPQTGTLSASILAILTVVIIAFPLESPAHFKDYSFCRREQQGDDNLLTNTCAVHYLVMHLLKPLFSKADDSEMPFLIPTIVPFRFLLFYLGETFTNPSTTTMIVCHINIPRLINIQIHQSTTIMKSKFSMEL